MVHYLVGPCGHVQLSFNGRFQLIGVGFQFSLHPDAQGDLSPAQPD